MLRLSPSIELNVSLRDLVGLRYVKFEKRYDSMDGASIVRYVRVHMDV